METSKRVTADSTAGFAPERVDRSLREEEAETAEVVEETDWLTRRDGWPGCRELDMLPCVVQRVGWACSQPDGSRVGSG